MKVAAIYARVSSERQKEEKTIDSQMAAIFEYADSQGYTVPSEWIFKDEGYSGYSLARPGLERLRDLAAEGQIETILIYSPSRFSRKYAYQVIMLEEFARNGVNVIFIKSPKADTPEEKLLVQFQGMIAEYERAQITERTRRGKRYRAKTGAVSALSGAPYGYRYIKKTETCDAYYEVLEGEAEVVRDIYRFYTEEFISIEEITRRLNKLGILTRRGKSAWERSAVWKILGNPAYKGMACFGKTQRCERTKMIRPFRGKRSFSPTLSSSRQRPREEWIEIPVPAIISEETFALAQERLEKNKQFSSRHTKKPTILQGLLVCSECGHALYRNSSPSGSSKKKLYYYRCIGSDAYRRANGRICTMRPIRQDYLDEIVWEKILHLLANPDLIRTEIENRVREIQGASPTQKRKEVLKKEKTRIDNAIDKLLDAYQEDLLALSELRERIPALRKRQAALLSELQTLEMKAMDQKNFLQLATNIEDFLTQMRESAQTLNVKDRQNIVRLLVKEIHVRPDTIIIKHSIPTGSKFSSSKVPNLLLCPRSQSPVV
jgi:site-specific DNA recombinase